MRVPLVRRLCRCVVVVAAVAGLSTTGLLPADGVQTAKFGLAATGARSKIVHSPSASPIPDGVIVYNRTARQLTVTLSVVGVTRRTDGTYALGVPGTGLAGRIRLDAKSVSLPPKGRREIPLVIDSTDDVKSPTYAAVTAVAGPASSPGVSVTERLAVLVEVAPGGGSADAGTSGTSGTSHKRWIAVLVATLLLLALLALLASRFVLRRRRP